MTTNQKVAIQMGVAAVIIAVSAFLVFFDDGAISNLIELKILMSGLFIGLALLFYSLFNLIKMFSSKASPKGDIYRADKL